jgi:hypothetical protein
MKVGEVMLLELKNEKWLLCGIGLKGEVGKEV